MGERPDLDELGRAAVQWELLEMGAFEHFADQTVKLVMYCRELEAENKRLQGIATAAQKMRANMDGHYVPAEDIYLFDGACEDFQP